MTRAASELTHLFRQLTAPAAARALPKLADRARAEAWTFEQFAAALLKTETDSRDSHGGQSRIKAARFPARKTLEEFDFLAGRENVICSGRPGPVRRIWPSRSASAPAWPATASPSAPPLSGSPCLPTPKEPAASTTNSPGCNASRC